jgi:L-gulonate 3-dehydrogenase
VQECVPELLDLKIKVWMNVDANLPPKSASAIRVLASSSSAIVPSKMSEKMKNRDQFMVAHPVSADY